MTRLSLSHTVTPRTTGLLSSIAFSLLALGCVGETVVGDPANDGTGGDPANDGTGGDPAHENPDPNGTGGASEEADPSRECNGDYAVRAVYEIWRDQPNDLGVFAASTWEGTVDGGPDVRLVIEADHRTRLEVGEPVWPTDKDVGYLCNGSVDCVVSALLEGGTYPIYGALTTGDRVNLPINSNSAFVGFCELQPPILNGTIPNCNYVAAAHLPFSSTTPTDCWHGLEPVDCGWWLLVNPAAGVCDCASERCYPRVNPGTGNLNMDLIYDASSDTLEGTMLNTQHVSARLVRLSRVE
jgi:hypothetical protein